MMKNRNLFLRLALLVAVWAFAIPESWGGSSYYQYNVHVAVSPTGFAKVYVKHADDADDAYKENNYGYKTGTQDAKYVFKYKYEADALPSNYFFVGWSKDKPATNMSEIVSSTNPSDNITIQSEKFLYSSLSGTQPDPMPSYEDKQLVYANFSRLQVNVDDVAHGKAAILGTLQAMDGDDVRIKATANSGYKFAGWKRNDATTYASTSNPYAFTVSDETAGTYTACFEESSLEESHSIIIEDTPHGTISADTEDAMANMTVTLIVTPNSGYETTKVTYDEIAATMTEGKPTEYTFDMPNDNVYVNAKFIPAKPTGLTVTDIADGKATVTWEANGLTTWKLQYGSDSSFAKGTYTEMNVSTTPSVTLTELDEDQGLYYVRVKACNETDESKWSDPVYFQPPMDKFAIGSGTKDRYNIPTNVHYNYSLTQQIYTATELGEAGLIESIDFCCNTAPNSFTRNLDIYMVGTYKNEFENDADWIPVTDEDLVFSGEVTFAQNKWTTIALDTPFAYDGTQNIAIIVDDNTGSWITTNINLYFLTFSTGEAKQAIYVYNDNYNFYDPTDPTEDPYPITLTEKNQIRLVKSKLDPYAVLSEDGETLTFYFDGDKAKHQSEVGEENVFDVAWDELSNSPTWNGKTPNVETVEFDKSFGKYHGLTSTRNMFLTMPKLTTINGLEYLNTENVKNMEAMFYGCKNLTTLDLSNFNTENVENMYWMFQFCENLKTLDLSSFDLKSATNISQMFSYCYKLETIYTAQDANWEDVGNTKNMFYGCSFLSGKYGSDVFRYGLETEGNQKDDGTYAFVFTGDKEIGGYFTYRSNVDYELEVTDAEMATLYLDYDALIPESENIEGVFYCTGLDDDEAIPTTTAKEITGVIPANTGVFVKAKSGLYVFKHYTGTDEIDDVTNNILTGSVKETKVNAHEVLTLGYGNRTGELGFWWFTAKNPIPGYRAWIPGDKLTSTEDVKGIRIIFDDGYVDAIDLLPADQESQTGIYDLQGRKMEGKNLRKGLYIVNGKKTMVK